MKKKKNDISKFEDFVEDVVDKKREANMERLQKDLKERCESGTEEDLIDMLERALFAFNGLQSEFARRRIEVTIDDGNGEYFSVGYSNNNITNNSREIRMFCIESIKKRLR